ncbi:MAG: DUF4349 domain-containing protein [Flavobacterium sp.]|nr:DUF4349 domain-containing protein [Flavobacterium sp.]
MKRIILFMAIIAVLLTSCGQSKEFKKNKEKALVNDVGIASATTDTLSLPNQITITEEIKNNAPNNAKEPVNIDWDKKIIKTADIALQVKDYTSFNKNIHSKVKNYGAYIATEEQSQTDGGVQNSISIKVPVEQFENLLNSFSNDAVTVVERKISTQDVTAEVVDTKARIEAKKQVRNRYMDLLKQAKNMKEILEVQEEINGVQEAIESGAGRVTYLTHNAAYSTINLRYFQYSSSSNTIDNKPGFFAKFKEAFVQGATIVSDLLLFFTSIWPIIIVSVIAWFVYKKMKPKSTKV